jgi:hypothetical protein
MPADAGADLERVVGVSHAELYARFKHYFKNRRNGSYTAEQVNQLFDDAKAANFTYVGLDDAGGQFTSQIC